jgi:hypothetical protein
MGRNPSDFRSHTVGKNFITYLLVPKHLLAGFDKAFQAMRGIARGDIDCSAKHLRAMDKRIPCERAAPAPERRIRHKNETGAKCSRAEQRERSVHINLRSNCSQVREQDLRQIEADIVL